METARGVTLLCMADGAKQNMAQTDIQKFTGSSGMLLYLPRKSTAPKEKATVAPAASSSP